jgi:hypothetical protein
MNLNINNKMEKTNENTIESKGMQGVALHYVANKAGMNDDNKDKIQ